MTEYNDVVRRQVKVWKIGLLKEEKLLKRMTKRVQIKINEKIPQPVHNVITQTVKGIIHSVFYGIKYIPGEPPRTGLSLKERDKTAREVIDRYRKIASVEGAGTGVGGFLLGITDFPALIAIKMRMLFELAHVYGYGTRSRKERLFVLYIFQITFTTAAQRKRLLPVVEEWDKFNYAGLDWEQFQKDYRDALDFRKMMQLIPGIGAVVGAWANYGLLGELGLSAMNCYRIRYLKRERD